MREVTSVDELVGILRDEGKVLWAPAPRHDGIRHIGTARIDKSNVSPTYALELAVPRVGPVLGDDGSGLTGRRSDLVISEGLREQLYNEMKTDTSSVCRYSTCPIVRAFVYVDISDFSQMLDGIQLQVVQALIRIARETAEDIGKAEAALCIGDGYIYVWDEAIGATRFAANLANAIEESVANGECPEFHFRMGVHVGSVRWFRDPGRDGWNYAGSGINGGNRVLSAIGKETDDVVFVSGEVRTAIRAAQPSCTLPQFMHNRGRRADKHGELRRVYELNHSALPHW